MAIPVNLQIFPIGKANRSPHHVLNPKGTLRQPQCQPSLDASFHSLGLLQPSEQNNRVAATKQGNRGTQVCQSKEHKLSPFRLPKLCACSADYNCVNLSIGSALQYSGALQCAF